MSKQNTWNKGNFYATPNFETFIRFFLSNSPKLMNDKICFKCLGLGQPEQVIEVQKLLQRFWINSKLESKSIVVGCYANFTHVQKHSK